MSKVFNSSRATLSGFALVIGTTLLVACGDRPSMAAKSQTAFEDAQKKGLPIDKGGHGGHENMDMSGSKQGDMKGMDMSGSKQGDMKGMDMSGSKQGDMKGMDMSGSKQGEMKGMDMSGMKHGDMKGMDMSGMKQGDMKGMDMSGMKHGDMKGMDMSGMKHGDMKGMDMSGMKHGDMKGMDMSGMEMSPVVPQPKALQAKPGQAAATLQADPLDAPAGSSIAAAQQSGEMNMSMGSGEGMSMSMNSYVQHDVGRDSSSSGPMKEMDHDMPGMKMDKGSGHDMAGMKHEPVAPKKSTVVYACASHPEVVRDQPGKCPIDGTPLVKKEKK